MWCAGCGVVRRERKRGAGSSGYRRDDEMKNEMTTKS